MHGPVLAGNTWRSAAAARRGDAADARERAGRSDVSVILTDDGSIVEWVKYTPYGEPIAIPAGDTDSDFAWDQDDERRITDFITGGGTYDVRLHPTLTGTVDYADIDHANSIIGGGGGYQTLGRGVLSSEGVQNRFGYAGYRYDHHLAGAERHLYHVRHRVYQAHIGRWATRDPLGYVDGMGLYQYVLSQPILRTDPSGLLSPPPNASWGHGCAVTCNSAAPSSPMGLPSSSFSASGALPPTCQQYPPTPPTRTPPQRCDNRWNPRSPPDYRTAPIFPSTRACFDYNYRRMRDAGGITDATCQARLQADVMACCRAYNNLPSEVCAYRKCLDNAAQKAADCQSSSRPPRQPGPYEEQARNCGAPCAGKSGKDAWDCCIRHCGHLADACVKLYGSSGFDMPLGPPNLPRGGIAMATE